MAMTRINWQKITGQKTIFLKKSKNHFNSCCIDRCRVEEDQHKEATTKASTAATTTPNQQQSTAAAASCTGGTVGGPGMGSNPSFELPNRSPAKFSSPCPLRSWLRVYGKLLVSMFSYLGYR